MCIEIRIWLVLTMYKFSFEFTFVAIFIHSIPFTLEVGKTFVIFLVLIKKQQIVSTIS
jgi:hypothetical protein